MGSFTKTELTNISAKDERNFSLVLILGFLFIPLAVAALAYLFFTYGVVSPNQIGQIGEFFGGWLSPLFGLFVAILLIFTIRFQIQQTRLLRLAIDKSAHVQNKLADSNHELLNRSHTNFELESSAKALISLVEQADKILNTKVNIYVDIINFDNKLPHETRLFNVIDSWKQDIEHNKSLTIKFRHDRDAKVIAKYLHNIHHEIYICQSLIKNKGWVYISPYVKSITEHVEAVATLNYVGLITDAELWKIKCAVHNVLEKLVSGKLGDVILDSEIIGALMKDKIETLFNELPTPEDYQEEAEKRFNPAVIS